MALAESQKLLFNITFYQPSLVADFTDIVPSLFTILFRTNLPAPPLEQTISTTINALLNLDLPGTTNSTPANTDRLVEILSKSIDAYSEAELDTKAMPLVTFLRKYNTASTPETQESLKTHLLPSDKAREQPLGKDNTLASRLLRLSSSASLLQLRDNVSTLLFELSDSDPSKFIHNIGYGHAAGFLATHQIDVPQEAMGGQGASSSGSGTGADVNPVTGQWRNKEEVDDLPEMTEEEKEREAERLYVLFER